MSGKLVLFAAGLTIAALASASNDLRADALVTQGIGITSCGRLADDLKPSDGLANPVNLMLYSWVQGYTSAANLSLLEEDAKHVDLGVLDENSVLSLIESFCKANPDKKPVNVVDDLIRKSHKLKAKWEPGTVNWDE